MLGLFEVFLLFCFAFIIGTIYWYATIPKNLPPGPLGLPLIGSLWQFRHQKDQHIPLLKLVKQYGNLMKLYIGNTLFIILGDYDMIQEALVKQGDVFSGKPQPKALMPKRLIGYGLQTESDLWKEHRRFTLTTLRDFGIGRPVIEPKIKEEINHLSEEIQQFEKTGSSFDPQPLLTCCAANIICQLVFGRRFNYDDKEFQDYFAKMTEMVLNGQIGFFNPILFSERVASFVKRFLMPRDMERQMETGIAYNEREMNKTIATFDPESEPSNYIHAFKKVALENPGGTFTDNQLFGSVSDLFAVGTETTSTSLRYALLLLASHPEIQERMYKEIRDEVGTSCLPDYADRMKLPFSEAVVMESQRFANLTPFGVARRAMQATKLMGYDIPEDAVVVPFLGNVLHNPEVFPEPDVFKPDRFLDSNGKVIRDPKLIPFGAGKRICLGEPLARMELFLVLVGLISRYRFHFRDAQKKPDLKPVVGLLSNPKKYQVYVESRHD